MVAPLARLACAQQLTCLRSFQPAVHQWAAHRQAGHPGHHRRSWAASASDASSGAASDDDASAAESDMPGSLNPAAAAVEEPLAPGLYIVSTPIGNLEDITLRALRVLRTASMVLAEDTRHTRNLLNHFGIRTPLHSFHQHNEKLKEDMVLRQLQQGDSIALVSDAGTPAINDPGAHLVAAAAQAGLPVIPVPGASAVLAAVVASGLPTTQFLYCGFTAPKSGQRQKQFGKLSGQEATLVFFVSPHSLLAALQDAAAVMGPERRCCLARELTKRHEEFWRGTLAEALAEFTERGPRGEFVLLIEGLSAEAAAAAAGGGEMGDEQVLAALREAVAGGESASGAARSVAQRLGQNRKRVYQLSLTLGSVQQPAGEE